MKANSHNNNPKDIQRHTSVFASAAETISGTPSRKSFESRLLKRSSDDSRTIGSYRHSLIGQTYGVKEGAKKHVDSQSFNSVSRDNSRQAQNSGNSSPGSARPAQERQQRPFREPPPRGYNPLG